MLAHVRLNRFSLHRLLASVLLLSAVAAAIVPVRAEHDDDNGRRSVKVMIISMFGPEGQVWIDNLSLTQQIAIPGLSSDYPMIHCNPDDVCQMTAGMGHANVAASTMALLLSHRFDLRHTYFLIAGIAGIDPGQGTLRVAEKSCLNCTKIARTTRNATGPRASAAVIGRIDGKCRTSKIFHLASDHETID
jgi:purine nucleoside permease